MYGLPALTGIVTGGLRSQRAAMEAPVAACRNPLHVVLIVNAETAPRLRADPPNPRWQAK